MPYTAITWMQGLKRVFNIDIQVCEHCGGHVKVTVPAHPCAHGISASLHVIASIEDPKVIERIFKRLKHKAAKADTAKQHEWPPERAPPLTPSLFDPSQSRLFD